MEQIANVQAAAQPTSLRQMLGMGGQNAVQGDAFAMIFQQLMANGADGEEADTLAAMLMQMTGSLQKDAEDMGTKLAAELLYAMPGLQPQTLLAMLQNPDFTQQQPLQALTEQPVLQTLPQQMDAVLQQLTDAQPLVQPTAQAQTEEEGPLPFDVLARPQQAQPASEEKQQQPAPVELDYAVMRAIRETLAKNRKQENSQTPDIESLQADVNAGRFLRTDSIATAGQPATPQQSAQVPSGEEMAQQVKNSMTLHNLQGKNEFVVRLEPEGIGEIVVKLSEDKNRISLSILTTSTQTARLINNEVAALQSALRPLQAQVEEVTVMSSEQAAQYSAQNQMTDQGRQFYGQPQQQQQGHSHSFAQQNNDFDQVVQLEAADEVLDAYI